MKEQLLNKINTINVPWYSGKKRKVLKTIKRNLDYVDDSDVRGLITLSLQIKELYKAGLITLTEQAIFIDRIEEAKSSL